MDLSRKPRAELAAYAAWEADLGEPVVYRAAGHFLLSEGIDAPLRLWGLAVLTPTRLIFRHFSQPHPLFGGRDEEVLWELARTRVTECRVRRQGWWSRLLTGWADHCVLSGPGIDLAFEPASPARDLASAWAASAMPST
jgi:hypothetical protein